MVVTRTVPYPRSAAPKEAGAFVVGFASGDTRWVPWQSVLEAPRPRGAARRGLGAPGGAGRGAYEPRELEARFQDALLRSLARALPAGLLPELVRGALLAELREVLGAAPAGRPPAQKSPRRPAANRLRSVPAEEAAPAQAPAASDAVGPLADELPAAAAGRPGPRAIAPLPLWDVDVRPRNASEGELLRRVEAAFAVVGESLDGRPTAPLREEVRRRVLLAFRMTRRLELAPRLAAMAAEDKGFDLVLRRVRKLRESLRRTWDALQRVRVARTIDTGIASLFRSVQGLEIEDPMREVKREMLKDIFHANVELQKRAA